MRKSLIAAALALVVLAAPGVQAQTKRLTASEAKDHVGERGTVCGKVASTHYAATSRGAPTFLNLDAPYPRQIFTIVIWRSDRPKFGTPESKYRQQRICVTGEITEFRGSPQTVASEPAQIEIQ